MTTCKAQGIRHKIKAQAHRTGPAQKLQQRRPKSEFSRSGPVGSHPLFPPPWDEAVYLGSVLTNTYIGNLEARNPIPRRCAGGRKTLKCR